MAEAKYRKYKDIIGEQGHEQRRDEQCRKADGHGRNQPPQQKIPQDIRFGQQVVEDGSLRVASLRDVCLRIYHVVETQPQAAQNGKGSFVGEVTLAIAEQCPANAQRPDSGDA